MRVGCGSVRASEKAARSASSEPRAERARQDISLRLTIARKTEREGELRLARKLVSFQAPKTIGESGLESSVVLVAGRSIDLVCSAQKKQWRQLGAGSWRAKASRQASCWPEEGERVQPCLARLAWLAAASQVCVCVCVGEIEQTWCGKWAFRQTFSSSSGGEGSFCCHYCRSYCCLRN